MKINGVQQRSICSYRLWLSMLSVGLLSFLMVVSQVMPVQAFQFDLGVAQGYLDTTLSYGAAFRVQKRDSDLVGIANGGNAQSVNIDDGNLNYDRGIVSNVVKVTSELDLYRENYGVFLRGTAFYDYENDHKDRERTQLTSDAKDLVGSDIEMLDYYAWYAFDIGSVPVQLRVGDQVVSWGESTFIQGGINCINPVDVSAIRLPGAELKEALVPEGMVWASFGLTDNLTIEALYLYDWEETTLDPVGSYFSTNDYVPTSGTTLTLGNGLVPEGTFPYAVKRSSTKHASNSGQFGVAARLFIEKLNSTEFGLYYLKYHSRTPVISALKTERPGVPAFAHYFTEYVEDIQLLGLSFSTEIGGVALQGDLTHRFDEPLQIEDKEILKAGLGAPSQIPGKYAPGEAIDGYELLDTTQFQMTATQLTGPTLGADQGVLVCEAGARYVHDLPDEDELRFEAPGKKTNGTEIYQDDFAWGYRARAQLSYLNAIGGMSLFPRVSWRHDVSGNSGSFLGHRKAITFGLKSTYQNWKADISYTNFFGAGNFNKINDRDMVAFNIKYSF
ncbi:MAG: hypothetical protein DRH03_03290 [Deltaproteobacteria bacterium]|nr:MAG: hypothetical protein DRH03_03290 [Deltaproteobacteria bacterium]